MIDLQSGEVKVADDLCVHPNFTFEDFKKSGFYNNKNEVRVIYLDEIQVIDNRKYAVSLCFRDKRISVLSLLCCDEEYTHETEVERKVIHDMILRELNIIGYKKFSWVSYLLHLVSCYIILSLIMTSDKGKNKGKKIL